MKILFALALFFCLNAVAFSQDKTTVLKTDFEGQVSEGSIEKLIEEIQAGKSVRVGWQLDFDKDGIPDVEHWIDANFISILNGHVFNQIDAIYRQVPKKDIPQVELINSTMMWMGIIGTNGKLIHQYILEKFDDVEDEKILAMLEKQAKIKETVVATIWVVY